VAVAVTESTDYNTMTIATHSSDYPESLDNHVQVIVNSGILRGGPCTWAPSSRGPCAWLCHRKITK